MRIYDHGMGAYKRNLMRLGADRWNGAVYYSHEIVRNIIPRVKTDRSWVTVNCKGMAEDRAIVFVHNNKRPDHYEWLSKYDDLVLVCGVPSTCEKVAHLGTAVHLPLSIDVAEVEAFARKKDRGTCYVGRAGKRAGLKFPAAVDYLEGMPRREMLGQLARYRKAYAVGRCALEAKVLGCEVLPYDERFPDPSIWQVIDNRDAAGILQGLLDAIDGEV